MKALWYGFYSTRIYLPLSSLSRRWRRFSHRIRGKRTRFLQDTRLPAVSWRSQAPARTPSLWENQKENGNVRISELGILAALASDCADHTNLFEIGTFDGRTTLNLALNSPQNCRVHTLDLPPELATRFDLAEGERHLVEKPKPGTRYEKHRASKPGSVGKIHQWLGDSATFNFEPYASTCSLVFVDGSHAYDYALSDSRAAMSMVRPGGVVIWHDYGIWEGVTQALGDLEERERHGLKHIRGTSLVYWRRP